jgi:hypothetical protein
MSAASRRAAGTTAAPINVNFQPAGTSTPDGYIADTGSAYGKRWGGYVYGWNKSMPEAMVDRNPASDANQLDDTFAQMQTASNPDAVWEMEVANGWYQVQVSAGDTAQFDSIYRVDVEGMLAVNAKPSNHTRLLDGTVNVQVTDGRLTVRSASGAVNDKLSSLVITPLTTAPTVVKVTGSRPDHDDAKQIQTAIDALPAGATLVLEPRTYRLQRGIVINKPIRLEGQNATLLLDHPNYYPGNQTIRIASRMASQSYQWNQTIRAGTNRLNVAVPTTAIKAGDWVRIGLGQDPYDANEEHFATLARVTENTGNSITLDVTIPRDINNGSRKHWIQRVDSLAEGVTVRNLKLDWTDGSVPDINIAMDGARNVTVENIEGRFSNGFVPADSQNVTLRNVDASVVKLNAASGGMIGGWETSGLVATNVHVRTAGDNPVVFLESWNRSATIDDLTVDWTRTTDPRCAVFHVTGGSANTAFDDVTIINAQPISLVSGGEPVTFGRLDVSGPVKNINLSTVNYFTNGDKVYGTALHTTTTVNLKSGSNPYSIPLTTGLLSRVTVTISDGQGVTGLFAINGSGQGSNMTTGFTAGTSATWVYTRGYGTDFAVDDQNWKLDVYTASVAAGATMTIEVEYYWP